MRVLRLFVSRKHALPALAVCLNRDYFPDPDFFGRNQFIPIVYGYFNQVVEVLRGQILTRPLFGLQREILRSFDVRYFGYYT